MISIAVAGCHTVFNAPIFNYLRVIRPKGSIIKVVLRSIYAVSRCDDPSSGDKGSSTRTTAQVSSVNVYPAICTPNLRTHEQPHHPGPISRICRASLINPGVWWLELEVSSCRSPSTTTAFVQCLVVVTKSTKFALLFKIAMYILKHCISNSNLLPNIFNNGYKQLILKSILIWNLPYHSSRWPYHSRWGHCRWGHCMPKYLTPEMYSRKLVLKTCDAHQLALLGMEWIMRTDYFA